MAGLLREPLRPVHPGIPRIGLLHADLDASGGSYAPIRQSELDDTALDAWLLGHIHKPSLSKRTIGAHSYPCGYLGSLVGLDPSEQGDHGPWMITVTEAGVVEAVQCLIAPLRWMTLSIGVDPGWQVDDIEDLMAMRMEEEASKLLNQGVDARAVGFRIRLQGTSRHYEPLQQMIAGGSWDKIGRSTGPTAVFLNKVINGLEPYVDLKKLAQGDDPAALLAKRILLLEAGGEGAGALLAEAHRALAPLTAESKWASLAQHRNAVDPLEPGRLRAVYLQVCRNALDAMLAQRQLTEADE